MVINVDEVVLGLDPQDYSYLDVYPLSEYDINEELISKNGYKIVHITKKNLKNQLAEEDYYMLSSTIKAPCEFFKVVEYYVE